MLGLLFLALSSFAMAVSSEIEIGLNIDVVAETPEQYDLPSPSFWDTYGIYIVVIAIALIVIILLRKKKVKKKIKHRKVGRKKK